MYSNLYMCFFLLAGAPSSDPDHPDYVPSLHMTAKPDQKEPKMHRYNRVIKRRTLFNAPVSSSGIDQPPPSASGSSESSTPSASSQSVDADSCDNPDCITKMTSLENRIRGLEEKCRSLEIENTFVRNERDTLKTTLTKFSSPLKDITDKKMRFYTGIPTVTSFFWLFNIVCSLLSERRTISKENQLYLTLMKLRMGTSNRDLSYRFGISAGTVSSIFNECIPALASRLEFLIKWPSRDMLARNMPKKFLRRFRRCRVIIDCTEFFIDRPYNLKTRARTWSNYKHHHTLKALIGITPYGSVSFVSKMWGGRISDKEVTAKSHFYELIEYGDQVMADRGFTISNELAEKGATLVMPPFVKGRKQLPGMAVERARQLSALRIHVERAIERIKNFAILKNIMPLTFLPIASDILTVCAALTNLQPKLIN